MAENMQDGKFIHDNTIPPTETRVLPLFSLKGKTAIVTGAAAGIGYGVAQALAEAGADVAIWYNTNKVAVERAAEIEKTYGVKCKAYQVNITTYETVQSAVDTVVSEFNGRLDIFIANSGIPWTDGPMLDGPVEKYRAVTAANLDGTYYCARAAGAHWRRQKREGTTVDGRELTGFTYGSFVATASMSAHVANIPQLQAAYNASKAGVVHLCKSLGVEWASFARANSVSPGYIDTEISSFCSSETKRVWKDKIPLGREGQVHELKGAYLFLASDASSYMTGSNLTIDGGYCAV